MEGWLNYEIAELMVRKNNASLFVLDFVPNVSPEQIEGRLIPFVEICRKANPETSTLLIENMQYTTTLFAQNKNKSWQAKNANLRNFTRFANALFDKIKTLK
jgi:hypothetical protein